MRKKPISTAPSGVPVNPFPRSSSRELNRLYGRDYFDGVCSGYQSPGYHSTHPDWEPWLALIEMIQPRGRLIDMGCAFGYLLEAARGHGYEAIGLDISSYALEQEAGIAGRIRADLHSLPLPSDTADVVTLFDVLEHLEDPRQALQEAARILKPDGLLVGATPDPLFFERKETTHVFERPPSFWLEELRSLKLDARFRFSDVPYNFQFVAAAEGSSTASRLSVFQHDYFAPRPDFVDTSGPLVAVPRSGWGELQQDGRSLQDRASIYLFNPGTVPLECRIRFRVSHRAGCLTLRVGFNSIVLREWILTSEGELPPVDLTLPAVPAGGHHLWFEVRPSNLVQISELTLVCQQAGRRFLTLSLPFDLFQRYELSGQVASILGPASVLDIGGYLGDEGGHLATSADFLLDGEQEPGTKVVSTDMKQGDWPAHHPAPAWQQPFADSSFELVLSLDVLEHLPPSRRAAFLDELDRVSSSWILLAAPFRSPDIEEAEDRLREGLFADQQFLQEHREMGLPDLDTVRQHFLSRGHQVEVLPNGYLPRWTVMQVLTCLYFAQHDWTIYRDLNRLYNESVFQHDQREPAYRHHLLVSKRPLGEQQLAALGKLRDPGKSRVEMSFMQERAFLELNHRLIEQLGQVSNRLVETQFLFGEREKLNLLLEEQLREAHEEVEDLRYRTPLIRLLVKRLRRRLGSPSRPPHGEGSE